MESNHIVFLVVLLALVAIGGYFMLYKKDNFCVCSKMDEEHCSDPNVTKQLYADGIVTEYTFPQLPQGRGYETAYDAFMSGSSNTFGC